MPLAQRSYGWENTAAKRKERKKGKAGKRVWKMDKELKKVVKVAKELKKWLPSNFVDCKIFISISVNLGVNLLVNLQYGETPVEL